jgi:hypothetical protein
MPPISRWLADIILLPREARQGMEAYERAERKPWEVVNHPHRPSSGPSIPVLLSYMSSDRRGYSTVGVQTQKSETPGQGSAISRGTLVSLGRHNPFFNRSASPSRPSPPPPPGGWTLALNPHLPPSFHHESTA